MVDTQTESPALLSGLSELDKKQLTAKAQTTVALLKEEGMDVIGITTIAVKVKHFATELEKAGKAAAYEDVCLYGKGGVSKNGVKLLTKDTGTKYDYSDDPIWRQLKAVVDAASAKLKEHEELLKRIPNEGMGLTDPDTGETYHARRPAKTATQSIEATIL